MKSRISFSDLMPLRKDITRYAPLWALYSVAMMLVLVASGNGDDNYFAKWFLGGSLNAFGPLNLCYAGLCALALFDDLFHTRMCYGLHALPQRRETWFLHHMTAGLLFSLVPNLLAALYMIIVLLGSYWYLALYWLLAITLEYLFFFGLATACAMLAGNRAGMVTVYGLLNFLSILVRAVLESLYIPHLAGVQLYRGGFDRLSPAVYLTSPDFFRFSSHTVGSGGLFPRRVYVYEGLGTGWGYVACIGVVGLVALGVALVLYRRRHLEAAGDFVAFPRIKLALSLLLTLTAAYIFGLLSMLLGANAFLLWLAAGMAVGHFCGLMLLERRLKVFRKKTVLAFVVILVVISMSFTAVEYDWFGIASWTPKAGNVRSVTVANHNSERYYGQDDLEVTVKEEAAIADIIRAHEDILARLNEPTQNSHWVKLTYKLKSGRTVVRSYRAPANGVNYELIMKYLYTKDTVLGFADWKEAVGSVQFISNDKTEIPSDFYGAVLEALEKDYALGRVVHGYNGNYYLSYRMEQPDGTSISRTVSFSDSAENLITLMKSTGFQMGYTDWDAFLDMVTWASMDGMTIQGEDRRAMLEAIRKDVENGSLQFFDFGQDTLFVISYEGRTEKGDILYREFCIHKYAENTLEWIQEYMEKQDEWNPEGV